jgi:hypothetical protein
MQLKSLIGYGFVFRSCSRAFRRRYRTCLSAVQAGQGAGTAYPGIAA